MSFAKLRPFFLGLNVSRSVRATRHPTYFDVLAQDCGNATANELELL